MTDRTLTYEWSLGMDLPVGVSIMSQPETGPCRLCGVTSHGGDDEGPVHACCHAWRKVIAAGYKCPACQVAAIIMRQSSTRHDGTPRAVRLPLLPPLPRTLLDGSLFVPEVGTSHARTENDTTNPPPGNVRYLIPRGKR